MHPRSVGCIGGTPKCAGVESEKAKRGWDFKLVSVEATGREMGTRRPPPPQVLSTRVLAEGGGMMGLTATHNLVVMKQFLSVPIRGGVL